VAQVLLDRAQRNPGRRQRRRERVPEVVEADLPYARLGAARLESSGDLCAVERRAQLWMSEDEVVVLAEDRPQTPLAKLHGESVGDRDGSPCTQVGLPLAGVLAADPGVPHTDAARRHVDIAPSEAQQLRLPESRAGGSEDEHAEDRSERIAIDRRVRDDGDHSVQLGQRQELEVRARPGGAA
jgi:hypothetical protein